MVSGSFASQFKFFKFRNGDVWFDALPVTYVKATKTATDLSGTYEMKFPNIKGMANSLFTQYQNQELWFAHIPTNTMYRVMAGQVSAINPDKNGILEVDGRGLLGLFTDIKLNQSWTSMRGDFILCDPTFGAIPTNYPTVTCWNGFTNDFDKWDYWNAARWGTQPAWCNIIDGEMEATGNGATQTEIGLTSYNYEVIEFRAKVSAAASSVRFGVSNIARGEYVQFSLNASNVTCETKSAGSATSTATVDAVAQTSYNYYRIEWDNGSVRFLVNGVLEQTIITNVPAGLCFPFFETATSTVLTLDYVKLITLTNLFGSYVANSKIFSDVVADITDVGNATTPFSFFIDDDWDFHAFQMNALPSGFSYGYNSAIYTGKYSQIISLDLNDDAKDLYNYVRVTGGEKLIKVAAPTWNDQFIGDGTQTSFTLGFKANKPLTLLQVGGATKTENTDFTVTYGTDSSVVKFNSAPAGSATINVRYDYLLPIIATTQNNASIAQYKVTREYDISDSTITSDERASNLAAALLAYYSDPRFVIKVVVPLDPRLQVGTTVMIDAPYYGIANQSYQIIELSWEMGAGTWQSELTLESTEINTSAEIIREILQQLKDLQTQNQTNSVVSSEYFIGDGMGGSELLEYYASYYCDSAVLGIDDNDKLGRGTVLDDFEFGAGAWIGTSCALTSDSSTFIVGAKSMKLVSSSTSWAAASTQSLGDLSAYTAQASGHPTTGTVGVWVYCTSATDIISVSLSIGSSASNFTTVAGVKSYTNSTGAGAGFTCRAGWNYYVFRLKNGTEFGTPDWTHVSYALLSFSGANGVTNYIDYLTVGQGDSIGLNGLGGRFEVDSYATVATG